MNLAMCGPSIEDLCGPPSESLRLSRLPPPISFDLYDVERVSRLPHPPSRRRPSAAQAAGLRYEKKAKAFLSSQFAEFVDGPWFSYRRLRDHTKRFCQPDGFVAQEETLILFEIKLRWTAETASQLLLYREVLRAAALHSAFRMVCITRAFDPSIKGETRTTFIHELCPASRTSPNGEGAIKDCDIVEVFIWRP